MGGPRGREGSDAESSAPGFADPRSHLAAQSTGELDGPTRDRVLPALGPSRDTRSGTGGVPPNGSRSGPAAGRRPALRTSSGSREPLDPRRRLLGREPAPWSARLLLVLSSVSFGCSPWWAEPTTGPEILGSPGRGTSGCSCAHRSRVRNVLARGEGSPPAARTGTRSATQLRATVVRTLLSRRAPMQPSAGSIVVDGRLVRATSTSHHPNPTSPRLAGCDTAPLRGSTGATTVSAPPRL